MYGVLSYTCSDLSYSNTTVWNSPGVQLRVTPALLLVLSTVLPPPPKPSERSNSVPSGAVMTSYSGVDELRSYQEPRTARPSVSWTSGPMTAKSKVLSLPKSSFSCRLCDTVAEPIQRSPTLRVMMLITPPRASAPYSVDAGPRITSTRSIMSSGGTWLNWLQPELLGSVSTCLFWRLPSMRISV